MKLQCPECKTLNDDGSQTCVNPDCGASLRFAEQVEDPAHAPESAAGTPQAAGKACDCEYPDPDPGTGICISCDEPVKPKSAEAPPSDAPPPSGVSEDDPEPAPTDSPAPIHARLILPDGNALRLTGGVTVGRDVPETRDALIHFDGVSRIHCWLVQKSDTIFIVDLGSKNGTWYRGERLLAHALHHFSLSALPIYMRLGHSAQLEIIGDHSA